MGCLRVAGRLGAFESVSNTLAFHDQTVVHNHWPLFVASNSRLTICFVYLYALSSDDEGIDSQDGFCLRYYAERLGPDCCASSFL